MAKRSTVYINKPSQPVIRSTPIVMVPLVSVMFDIARRTSCDPVVAVSTGPGDPGFDPKGPKTGNFLVPAIYRRECGGTRPKWYGW